MVGGQSIAEGGLLGGQIAAEGGHMGVKWGVTQ